MTHCSRIVGGDSRLYLCMSLCSPLDSWQSSCKVSKTWENTHQTHIYCRTFQACWICCSTFQFLVTFRMTNTTSAVYSHMFGLCTHIRAFCPSCPQSPPGQYWYIMRCEWGLSRMQACPLWHLGASGPPFQEGPDPWAFVTYQVKSPQQIQEWKKGSMSIFNNQQIKMPWRFCYIVGMKRDEIEKEIK
jgi:hypothetical protein